jgi:hypothetical protein
MIRMSSQPPRDRARLVAAMIIGALVVSASVLFVTSSYGLGAARTVTMTETTTSIVVPSSIPLYAVTFNETGDVCGYGKD